MTNATTPSPGHLVGRAEDSGFGDARCRDERVFHPGRGDPVPDTFITPRGRVPVGHDHAGTAARHRRSRRTALSGTSPRFRDSAVMCLVSTGSSSATSEYQAVPSPPGPDPP